MVGTRRLKELSATVSSAAIFPEGPVSIALSGGADSAALAWVSKEALGDVSAIHINHGLDGSPMMEEAAVSVARQIGLDLEVVAIEVESGPSPEAMAREGRYAAFDDLDVAVLTAHTREDSVETVLINMLRGTGLHGLTGIPYHRTRAIYRPLLTVSRNDVRELAHLAGLEFREDPANSDPRITRNRVRRDLLPLLREFNPRVVEAMSQMSRSLTGHRELVEGLVADFALGEALPTSLVLTAEPAVADRVLLAWLDLHGANQSASVLERVWTVVRGEASSQQLDSGKSVVRDRALIRVVRGGDVSGRTR